MSESDIKFNITMDSDSIDFSHKAPHEESTSFVHEESLLPGTNESRETTGFLPISHSQQSIHGLEFSPLEDQPSLMQLGLKSKGVDLHYELTHNNQLLIATAGDTDVAVFTVYLDQNGAYTFTLHNHIDRAPPANLLTLTKDATTNQAIPDWTFIHDTNKTNFSLFQDINTQPHEAYNLTFHFQPNQTQEPLQDIQVLWGNKLLYTLSGEEAAKGYTFSVEGQPEENSTKLQFTSQGSEGYLKDAIANISVTSGAQLKLPIDLSYCIFDNEGNALHHQFTVNVTTTPPIQLTSHEPFDVIYDQAVYQTIIVNEENNQATINLDNLFKNMAISSENRLVEVVQREENGSATNVYEVKISDKSQALDPITVADVQLSFPGGDGGIHVFQRHITIQEGGGDLISPHDPSFV
ncbi:MAG: hypothetical protein JSR17_06775 [Proteobacteria bacterium]|nr:hypothetical protein [Pseudomonadota bacterium]